MDFNGKEVPNWKNNTVIQTEKGKIKKEMILQLPAKVHPSSMHMQANGYLSIYESEHHFH